MPDNEVSATRRCETRFTIEGSEAGLVSITVTTDPDERVYTGFLADLSRMGLRIALDTVLESGSKVRLHVSAPAIQLNVTWGATVRWVQPKDAESWWIGCELHNAIPANIIESLATSGLLNRRRDPRIEISMPAQAKCELSEQVIDVEVVNYSKGGFCMRSSTLSSFPREQVMLIFAGEELSVDIPARVMWQRKTEQGYSFGCSFSTLDGFALFREAIEPGWATLRPLDNLRHRTRVSVTMWIAVAAFVLLAVKGLELMHDSGRPAHVPNALENAGDVIRTGISQPKPDDGQTS